MRGGYHPIRMPYVLVHDRLPRHPPPILDVVRQTRSSVRGVLQDIPGQCAMLGQLRLVHDLPAMDHCSSGDATIHSRVQVLFRLWHDRLPSPDSQQQIVRISSSRTDPYLRMTGSILRMIIDGDEKPQQQWVPTRQYLQPTRHSCSDHALQDIMSLLIRKRMILSG